MCQLCHGVKIDLDPWPWKLGHRLLKTHISAYLRNQLRYCFHIWYAYRLGKPKTTSDLLISVWPLGSKIGRGKKVGQSKTFSNHGLLHTKMTGMMSRMQNSHLCLPNFPSFGDIHNFVFSQCYQIRHTNGRVQCQLFQ